MARKYTEIDQIQNYILTTVDIDFAYQVNRWIEQMTQYIETTTGRIFLADEEESEKVYDGNGHTEMMIDEFTSIKKLTIGGVEILPADYYIYPNNQENKNKIVLKNARFTKGNQNVVVEAMWGYSITVPNDLIFACTVLVCGMIYNSWSQEGEVQSMSMGRYSVSYKDQKGWNDLEQSKSIIEQYKIFNF